MSNVGNFVGEDVGDWLGPTETNPGVIAASISGAGGITAALTFVEHALVAPGGSGSRKKRKRAQVEYWWEKNDPRERLWKHVEPPADPEPEPFTAPAPAPKPPQPAYAEIAATAVADELIRRAREAARAAKRKREDEEEEALLMELLND